MNIGELLGAMVQSGMAPSSNKRMKNSLGGGTIMDSLAGILGGASQKRGGNIADSRSGMRSGQGGRGTDGGRLADTLSGMLSGEGHFAGRRVPRFV
jgi:hypothetical protein